MNEARVDDPYPEAKLTAAVAMCNPFDLNMCDVALQKGFFGTVYSTSMAKNMRKLFAPHAHLFNGLPNYDRDLVESANTVRDFDEAVTRVTFGFPSVDAYYDASSSRLKIAEVGVPLLVVQASDDPIAVADAVPRRWGSRPWRPTTRPKPGRPDRSPPPSARRSLTRAPRRAAARSVPEL